MTPTTATPALAADGPEGELRQQALDRIDRRRKLRFHAVAHVLGSLFLAVLWATTEYHNAGGWPTGFRTGRMNHDWDPWILYPLAAGTVALAVHAWVASARTATSEAEIAGEMDRLRGRPHA